MRKIYPSGICHMIPQLNRWSARSYPASRSIHCSPIHFDITRRIRSYIFNFSCYWEFAIPRFEDRKSTVPKLLQYWKFLRLFPHFIRRTCKAGLKNWLLNMTNIVKVLDIVGPRLVTFWRAFNVSSLVFWHNSHISHPLNHGPTQEILIANKRSLTGPSRKQNDDFLSLPRTRDLSHCELPIS